VTDAIARIRFRLHHIQLDLRRRTRRPSERRRANTEVAARGRV
jgi:hypothetical protein